MVTFIKYLIIIFGCSISFGQAIVRDGGRILSGTNFNFYENLKISPLLLNPEDNNTIKYEEIEGSPYIDNNLPIGKIYSKDFELIKTTFLRYNAFSDNMEVSLDEDGIDYYLIKKLPDFLYFVLNNKNYRAYEYNVNSKKAIHYFVILSENDQNKSALLKKEKVVFRKGKKPENSFLTPTPHKFVRAKDEFYIKIDAQILEIPKRISDLTNLFPEKKKEIETYVASNKIKTTVETDLLELVNYYNSLFN